MFYKILLSGAFALLVSFSAQATLIGDEIDGAGTGIMYFNDERVVVTYTDGTPPEFDGVVTGTKGGLSGDTFNSDFNFRADGATDVLFIEFDGSGQSGEQHTLDFFVTFSDLNWDGEPNRILTGIHQRADDSYIPFGQGLSGSVNDRSFTLRFENFIVEEFRDLEIELLTTIDSTSSNPDPVPVPPAVGLGLMGMGLVGLTRRSRQNNKKV